MKKHYLLILLYSQLFFAQVGINTTVPNAQLDIRSGNQANPANTDGILIPKIDFFPSSQPSAAQQGMLVYLTTLVGSNQPGFYYWDNTTSTWISIGSSLNSWTLNGNANTNATTNFIGTTDNVDLTFKRNNAKAGSIEFTNSSFGNFAANSNTSGLRNVAVGALSSFTNSGGSDNVAVGYNTLSLNVGSENTSVGANALQQSPGGFNSAFGFRALNANTAGSNNVAIGHSAMQFGNGGSFNSALGYNALNTNNNGNNNVAIGASALLNNSASENTAVGVSSLRSNGSGFANAAFGYESLRNNTGSFNVGFGHSASFSNSSGTRNTALGALSLYSNNGGSNNVAIGYNAMSANTASQITAVGANALQQNSGGFNTAVGYNALNANTGGNNNTAVGHGALQNSNANQNSALGFNALNANGTGTNNTAMGFNALASSTSGTDNTAIGNSALIVNTASFNTAFGSNALIQNNGGQGNTAVGFFSMQGNTSGSLNTTMGYLSTVGSGSLTNATAIGAQAMVSSSNSLVLGSISGINSSFSNTNVGIGTPTPQDRLHVVGNIRMVDGNQGVGKILTSDANGTASWGTAPTTGWGLTGNSGIGSSNFIGTTNDADLIFKRFSTEAGRIGTTNTFFGISSGSVSTGTNNTYLGAFAGQFNISGTHNVMVGRLAGGNGTSGSDNVFVGNAAGILNTATQNTFVGSFAGNGNTTGVNNTNVGYSAGASTGGGGNNTSIGAFAGNVNTTGTKNTFLGSNSTAAANNLTNATAIGSDAFVSTSNSLVLGSVNGANSATVTVNVGIGTTTPLDRLHVVGNIRMVDGNQGAGKVLTSDANGTASWGTAPSTGWGLTGNSGIGSSNFIGTTNDADLIFKRFSTEAGRISSATSNTFFGLQSGIATTANNNAFFGTEAGRDNVGGQQNVYIGRRAAANGTSASDNVIIGNAAGLANTANQNTFLGSFSGNSNAGGANNTFLGFSTGTTNTTGGRNTFVGAAANVVSSGLSNATAIGYASFVGSSDSMVLGSISGVNSATSSTNVGIGTTTPLDRLHVVGSIRMVDGTQGNGKVLTSNANGTGSWQTLSTNYWGLNGNAGTNDPATPITYGTSTIGASENWNGTTDANDYVLGTNNIERFRIKQTTGFVGIGTAVPSRTLHLFTGSSGGTPNGNADFVMESNGSIYQHFLAPAANETGLLFGSNVSSIRGGVLYNNNTDILQFRAGGNTNRMIITSAGDVGIGNTPGGQFELSLDEGRKPGTTLWTVTSDARLKTVEGFFTKGLNEIRQLKPIRYHYKNVGSRVFEDKVLETEFSGFLAQDVQKVFPNCVTTDADGYLSLNMHEILIASINALKELDAKNNQLQTENEALKSELKKQQEQITYILSELEKRR